MLSWLSLIDYIQITKFGFTCLKSYAEPYLIFSVCQRVTK